MKNLFLVLVAFGCVPAFSQAGPRNDARLAIALAFASQPQATVDVFSERNSPPGQVCPFKGAGCDCGCVDGDFCKCSLIDSIEKARAETARTGIVYWSYDGGKTWGPKRPDAPAIQMPASYQFGGGNCVGGSCSRR